jgi:hypothetical protein
MALDKELSYVTSADVVFDQVSACDLGWNLIL